MKNRSERYIPLIVSVGQVAIFPYYILWLKQASLTFTLFTWFFAAFSFTAALGYKVFQSRKNRINSVIPFIYMGMGSVYILAGTIKYSFEYIPYMALFLQIILGFLQGYYHAWHIEQKAYRAHAVNHYLMVGVIMFGLSFVKIISPVTFITAFGSVVVICGVWLILLTIRRH
ncbi:MULTISPECIES: hypothetical protein [unclassified Bacillus (in: firmicutes)]|uniref:hypothetical protein n=1 Tax=unclassified Bacillus (in: firmicutes) TaxID=185979 RepID=UPI0008DFAACB|nr:MULTISPECIES: hypothetical protein [unclassified Bacillus (in: firmicutes)]SFA70022.1 hypothetical protein SAMN02799634_10176 [Bacillus sp. UNCCL13]SFQ59488.1 hypothetical protein SAMN04488577_0360 [Bacillus sp. cl95]